MNEIKRNPKLSVNVDGLLYLRYTFTPDMMLSHENLVMYEYFTNKQALIDRRTFLGKDCSYSCFSDGEAYIQNGRLYPSQL